MGQELYINNVVLNGISKSGLQDESDDLDREVASCREKLMMFAAGTPRPISDSEGNPIDWVEHVHFEVNLILTQLEEAIVRRHLVAVAISSPEDVTESY
jgi:hypothetical protein